MTTTQETPITAARAAELVTEFFAAYGRHDVEAMTEMCSANADFSYVPYEAWGKQRVLRGDGKVGTVGKPLWTGLIAAFPDLFNRVHTVDANDEGDVVVTCDIGGRQQSPWGFVTPQGKSFSEPHLFIFHVDAAGLIDKVKAYWDNAGISRQLGHVEVD
jgi:ketosteroid isomerase-like protein